MPLRRSTRIAILILALAAVAAVGGSTDPVGPDGQAGRRWREAPGVVPPTTASARAVVALADHPGRRGSRR